MNTTFLCPADNNELWSKSVRHQNTGFHRIYKPSGAVVTPSICSGATTQAFRFVNSVEPCVLMSDYVANDSTYKCSNEQVGYMGRLANSRD